MGFTLTELLLSGGLDVVAWALRHPDAGMSPQEALTTRYGPRGAVTTRTLDAIVGRAERGITAAGMLENGTQPPRAFIPIDPSIPEGIAYEYDFTATVRPRGYTNARGRDYETVQLKLGASNNLTPAEAMEAARQEAIEFSTDPNRPSWGFQVAADGLRPEDIEIEFLMVRRRTR